jgi:acylphosphatase
MNKYIMIQISGRVQGVWFRQSAKDFSDSIGLVGYVKNNADKTVTIEACGSDEQLKKLVTWCNEGSKMAQVDNVEVACNEECDIKFADFKIL